MNGTGEFAAPLVIESNGRMASAFVPTLLLALAVVASLGLQTTYLLVERGQLASASTGLMANEQAAAKVRASLDSLATATATLAASGNANAQAIVEQLRGRGVTINSAQGRKPP